MTWLRVTVLLCLVAVSLGCKKALKYPTQKREDLYTNRFWKCGVANQKIKSTRIEGGGLAEKNEFPWQVGLAKRIGGQVTCGGSIISSKTILTAAHCVTREMWAVLGEHKLTKRHDGERWIKICKKEKHDDYKNDNTFFFDFAILTTCKRIAFTFKIAPLCLPTDPGNLYENVDSIVAGWGDHSWKGKDATELKKLTVKTMANSVCTNSPNEWEIEHISDDMICAVAAFPSSEHCDGDSGGPLVTKNNDEFSYTQIGVVSFTLKKNCYKKNYPGVYARVTNQLKWIKDRMKGTKKFEQATSKIPGLCRTECSKGCQIDFDKGKYRFEYHRGSLYYFTKPQAKSTWNEAEKSCKYLGGHLASIHHQVEYDFILKKIKKENLGVLFVGGKRENNENENPKDYTWSWTDGTRMIKYRVSKLWRKDQPSKNKDANVMHLDKYGLASIRDSSKAGFVCRLFC